jgi:hypothetical protein
VNFAVPRGECIRRARSRSDHPTLGPESAAFVINRMCDTLVWPTAAESFDAVVTAPANCANIDKLRAVLLAFVAHASV